MSECLISQQVSECSWVKGQQGMGELNALLYHNKYKKHSDTDQILLRSYMSTFGWESEKQVVFAAHHQKVCTLMLFILNPV